MIISINPKPGLAEFEQLMKRTDELLNADARLRPLYYAKRNGYQLEDDVTDILNESARGTAFENTIEKVSGSRFPDIVAARYYGVEVKSTKENHWTSTGSSILESTRIKDVERIYMTFGKLGGTPQFISRPYEKCLSGIAVTHMPRYLIDMRLNEGETIFDKINIPYDELRKMKNPIAPVSKYYKSRLKPGESLWWINDPDEEAVSATIRLWKNIDTREKGRYISYGLVHFPEVFEGKYDNYAMWLTSQGIADGHIRDQFSAGGRVELRVFSGKMEKFPGVYRRVATYRDSLIQELSKGITAKPEENKKEIFKRTDAWINIVSDIAGKSSVDYRLSQEALRIILLLEEF